MSDLFPGYVIDTCALIDLWSRRYPRDVFPKLWENFEKLIKDGYIIAPVEVLKELDRQKDDLLAWAKKTNIFVELDAAQIIEAKKIINAFPNLIDVDKIPADADPFIVALARAKEWKVVTSELPKTAKEKKTKIPDVCTHFNVPCLNLLEFFRERGWRFE